MIASPRVDGHGRSAARRLPAHPASVGEARRVVSRLLSGAEREDLVDAATLLVSEVVTNALLHAGTDIHVAAEVTDEGLRVEVADGSSHLPVLRSYPATAGTGRGMVMLESMVDDWGVSRNRDGKTVWFELTGSEGPAHSGTADRRQDTDGSGVLVELRNVPLLLHMAWREHAETLLREYLLARLGNSESGDDVAIAQHADATDAIALLEEAIPDVDVGLEPDQLMQNATEPRVSSERLTLHVPSESVAHFGTLDESIERALRMSREGLLLTPPTEPEIQTFRRWVCDQVAGQAAGALPWPWAAPGVDAEQRTDPVPWDLATVANAASPRVAGDHANRIRAVSKPLLSLLGYDTEDELIGNRIVALIPERYRQAHVAGLTMYLLAGRQPMLNQVVVVPVLRRDGSERMVRLLIRAEALPDGMPLFLADLEPA